MKNDTEDLVDRYLQAVRFWLPKTQKEDIIAELSEEIRSQVEEKETALGRKLNQSEAEAILKQLGRPVLVANRYLPQQYLIGPVLFPIYKFVLKIVALCYLVPWILVWIGFMRFDRGYRAQHGPTLLQAAGSLWGSLWFTAFICAGVVTIVFAVLERSQAKSGFMAEWDPGKLPAVRDPNQISRATSIFEVVANAVFCLWWIDMWPRLAAGLPGLRITLAPAWRYFYWGALFVALAQMALSTANIIRPYWTRVRASIRLAIDGLSSGMICWFCKSDILTGISIPNVSSAKMLQITNAIRMLIATAFWFCVAVGLVIAAFDLYRILRVKAPDPRLTRSVAAI